MRGNLSFLSIAIFASFGICQPNYQISGTSDETSLLDLEDTAAGYNGYGLTINSYGSTSTSEGVISSILGSSNANSYSFDAENNNSNTEGVENFGFYGNVYGADNSTNIGVYGTAAGGSSSENYAGYFDGNVAVYGTCSPCSPSDIKFKQNIRALGGGLGMVMRLHPKIYNMDTVNFKNYANFSGGDQFGLIAQEVDTVLPEIVHDLTMIPHLTKSEKLRGERKASIKYKALNYTQLIPVMVEAIKEQQSEIDSLKAEIQAGK